MDQYSSSAQIQRRLLLIKGSQKRVKMQSTIEVKPLNFMWHAFLIFTLGGSSYLCMIPGPRRIGFFCGDESIRLPYKDSTIPMPFLHIAFYVILFPLIISVEYCCTKYLYSRYSSKLPTIFECSGHRIPGTIIRVCRFLLISQLGFMIDIFLLNITKYSTGRLRPHFFAVCRPSNISTIDSCGDAATYIENYYCFGNDDRKITEARLSFFSGHTSNSFYYAMFFSLYLHSRVGRTYRTSVAFPLLYTIFFGLAAVVGYSRISDNKHHPIDVLVGAIVGSTIAILMVLVFFRHQFFDLTFTPHEIKAVTEKSNDSESSSETDSNGNVETNSITTRVTTVEINPVPESEVIEIPLDDDQVTVTIEEKQKEIKPTASFQDGVIRPKILQRVESHV